MATVRLNQITRRFDGVSAIEDISFTVPDGEFWVLVGASGCGKSTILRTIAGLEQATSGELYIGDRRANDIPARDRDVAMVFQNYALYPHMTVAENLSFGLRMRGADKKTICDRVSYVAEILSIAHLLQRKPKQLSGGQQQRVALGRAIARQPQVFLLDEPLSNLDAQLRDEMRSQLKALHQQLGITTIYVTHDQTEAMTLSDRLVVLHDGQIQQIGTPLDVYNQPNNQTIASFLGSPPMNLFRATYNGSHFEISGQTLAASPPLLRALEALSSKTSPPSLTLGIRPEDIQLSSEAPASLQVRVSITEPLGRETLIRGAIVSETSAGQETAVNFFIPANLQPQPGEVLWVTFPPEHLLCFDPISEDLIKQAVGSRQ
ncbi:MAG: ABC transporter ATP-binding protein [Phormidium sp. GEM2.Bin31]|nr:ABC transporter ATP-binding protein [Phormidium sp. BM_Day4_Bin.17]TVR09570.1 MAG: ABC transporter ATP-binding protein [Phormidium sp. GEM2.Bin31]UCJ14496.1 MAG: ABC transporter ATP-binding protein [Phormidium sp. PBR-2020]